MTAVLKLFFSVKAGSCLANIALRAFVWIKLFWVSVLCNVEKEIQFHDKRLKAGKPIYF